MEENIKRNYLNVVTISKIPNEEDSLMEKINTEIGSGIIIKKDTKKVYIVTNKHVIKDSTKLSCKITYLDNKDTDSINLNTERVANDMDLALLSIYAKSVDIDKISVAKSDETSQNLGEQVYAIGNVLGFGKSVSKGIISAQNRKIKAAGTDEYIDNAKYIQTDATINPGNSGGGLFNEKGNLIGVVTNKITSDNIEGIAFAIRLKDVKKFLEEN